MPASSNIFTSLFMNKSHLFTANKNFWQSDVLTLGTLTFTFISLNFSEIRKTWLGVITLS